MLKRTNMINEYIDIYREKCKEYGYKTVILHQTGSFYEIYEIEVDSNIVDIRELSVLLDLKIANNTGDTNSNTSPNFIGFTMNMLNKYIGILLRAGYTVVKVEQLESSKEKKGDLVKRGVTNIYSPSLLPMDVIGMEEEYNLVSIIIELIDKGMYKKNGNNIILLNISICCVNNNNNNVELSENKYEYIKNDMNSLNLKLAMLDRVLERYNPRELQVGFKGDNNYIKSYISDNYSNVRFNEINKIYSDRRYQNEYLTKVYNYINFSLLSPIEYFKLEEKSLCVLNLVYILRYIERHDSSYLINISTPRQIREEDNVILELNTLDQLNVINENKRGKVKSVYDVINYTKTMLGARYLKKILTKPFKDANVIRNRYMMSEIIIKNDMRKSIDENLNEIVDLEKFHRKMSTSDLNQCDFARLDDSYNSIIRLIKIINESELSKYLLIDITEQLEEYIISYKNTFNIEKMRNLKLNSGKELLENFFCENVITELDDIQKDINDLEKKMDDMRRMIDIKINNKQEQCEYIKLIYNESDGYSFSCTKIRYNNLLSCIKKDKKWVFGSEDDWNVRKNNNSVKFIPKKLKDLSDMIIEKRTVMSDNIINSYKRVLNTYYCKYKQVFKEIKDIVEIIDVCNSNVKCVEKYNYKMPELNVKNEAFLDIKSIRHVIIEELGKNYISNDIKLDENNKGIICYGINSSGKSSLLRAIGISVIMAQAGLYVPCDSMIYSPFDVIISQVDLTDDIFSGKSSYINEMLGVKRILECSGPKTLVLSDELCKGTEHSSSVGIVAATIISMISRKSKFFFTTHIHELPLVDEIKKKEENIKIYHLSIKIINSNIIYERKLRQGSGNALYGIEVAKNILDNDSLIEMAHEIRNKLLNKNTNIKKSVYNRKKIIDKCQICGSDKQLETDHIIGQCESNKKGFLNDNRNKNHESNLCILCHDCHLKKTLGKIIINGYKDSINGVFLDTVFID